MQIIRATFGDAEPFELLTRHPTTAVFYFWELKSHCKSTLIRYTFIVNICLCQVIKAALCFVVSSREWCMLQDCILLKNAIVLEFVCSWGRGGVIST